MRGPPSTARGTEYEGVGAAGVTVGAGFGVTVTVVAAEGLPPAPVATAVYVVLPAGLTAWVPPLC